MPRRGVERVDERLGAAGEGVEEGGDVGAVVQGPVGVGVGGAEVEDAEVWERRG